MQSTPYEANFTLHLLHAVLSFSRMRVVMTLAVCNQHKFRGQGQCTEEDQSVESYAELYVFCFLFGDRKICHKTIII